MNVDISGAADQEEDEDEVLRQLRAGEVTVEERKVDDYRAKVLQAAPLYAQMFEQLLDPENRPFLFHCQGGKDRAGIGAALVLLALDVPRETIVQDYLLTDRYLAPLSEEAIVHYAEHYDMSVELMRQLADQRSVREAIEAIFDAMEDEYGSTDAYLRDALGLSDADRTRLQDALLI